MEWKPIKGYDDIYEVSEYGDIKSLSRLKINKKFTHVTKQIHLKQGLNKRGYRHVRLCKNKIAKTRLIHQLVGEHFVDNPNSKPQLNHKDGNKINNHYTNLEYVTVKENTIHAYENYLIPNRQQILLDVNTGVYYYSMRDASRVYGVSSSYMINMINGKKHNRTSLIKV